MNVTPITTPFPGEHLAGVSPVMTPTPEENWRSRLNFWTGRALTEQALCTEQENRAARLAWRGRLVTSGVVSGLEVAIESRESSNIIDTLSNQYIHIMPGYGIMATGEDVFIPRPLRVNLDDVPVVYGHKSGVVPKKIPAEDSTTEETAAELTKSWYKQLNFGGGTMRYHHLNKRYVPWAAVLVARPVKLYTIENRLSTEPCISDPSRYAFQDPRIADASQLVLVMVQPSLRKDGLLRGQQGNITWRNRVASKIFDLESSRIHRQEIIFRKTMENGPQWDTSIVNDDLLPWEYFGVPLGLIGFEPDPDPSMASLRRIFYDRNSVVRTGGRSRPRLRPALKVNLSVDDNSVSKGAGTPVLWQKRIEQFNEHLNDLLKESIFNFTSDMNDDDVRDKCLNLKSHFCKLPPAGLLPRAALDILTTEQAYGAVDRASTSWFFPSHYEVRAVPWFPVILKRFSLPVLRFRGTIF